jgi:hypothetical protein
MGEYNDHLQRCTNPVCTAIFQQAFQLPGVLDVGPSANSLEQQAGRPSYENHTLGQGISRVNAAEQAEQQTIDELDSAEAGERKPQSTSVAPSLVLRQRHPKGARDRQESDDEYIVDLYRESAPQFSQITQDPKVVFTSSRSYRGRRVRKRSRGSAVRGGLGDPLYKVSESFGTRTGTQCYLGYRERRGREFGPTQREDVEKATLQSLEHVQETHRYSRTVIQSWRRDKDGADCSALRRSRP